MNKEKQIEELANDINKHCCSLAEQFCGETSCNACLTHFLYNAGYRKQSWISVEDALPEQGHNVLCFENGKIYIAFREDYETKGVFWDWEEYDRYDSWYEVCPSHWMPLPEPPKGEEHE